MRCEFKSPSGEKCYCLITRREPEWFTNGLCVSCQHTVGWHPIPHNAFAISSSAHSSAIASPSSSPLPTTKLVCTDRRITFRMLDRWIDGRIAVSCVFGVWRGRSSNRKMEETTNQTGETIGRTIEKETIEGKGIKENQVCPPVLSLQRF